jgi:hypothetical protein
LERFVEKSRRGGGGCSTSLLKLSRGTDPLHDFRILRKQNDENIRKIYKNPLPYSEKCCIIILGVLYPERGMVVLFEII